MRELGKRSGFYGIKVSDTFENLRTYCALDLPEGFAVYIGNALDMFPAFDGDGRLRTAPRGVVTGPGNVFPHEWKRALELCRANGAHEAKGFQRFFEGFKRLYDGVPSGKNTIAALKYLLHREGILQSPRCCEQTGNLTQQDKAYLGKGYRALTRDSAL